MPLSSFTLLLPEERVGNRKKVKYNYFNGRWEVYDSTRRATTLEPGERITKVIWERRDNNRLSFFQNHTCFLPHEGEHPGVALSNEILQ